MRKFCLVPTAALAALTTTLPARGEARELTLAQALGLAEAKNEQLGIAREGVAQAEVALRAAWLRFIPTLTFTGRMRVNEREVRVGDRVAQRQANATGVADLSMTLFDPETVPGIAASRRNLEVEQARSKLERFNLLYSVTEAYLSVAIAQNAVEAASRSVETARDTARITASRARVGLALPIDQLRAELAITRAEGTLINAQAVLGDAQRFLQFLTAEDDLPQAVEGSEAFRIQFADPTLSLTERPDVKLFARTLALEATVDNLRWSLFLPELVLSGFYQVTSDGGFTNQNTLGFMQLALSWDLIDQGARWATLETNRSRRAQAALVLSLAERQAAYERDAADQRLRAAQAGLVTAQERLDLARKSRSQIAKTYAAGRANALDLITAEDDLRTAEIALTAEQLNVARTQLELLRAQGKDPTEIQP